jgi:hypothetical protein
MKKTLVWGIIIALLSMTAIAAEIEDTEINYTDYKELISGESTIVYKIKITNLGNTTKTYEFLPETTAVQKIGTYRIDPSSKINLKPEESKTIHLQIMVEKDVAGRMSVPLDILSEDKMTRVELVTRGKEGLVQKNGSWLSQVLKAAFYTLLALIIISLIIGIFRRKQKENEKRKKKGDDEEESPEVETYY